MLVVLMNLISRLINRSGFRISDSKVFISDLQIQWFSIHNFTLDKIILIVNKLDINKASLKSDIFICRSSTKLTWRFLLPKRYRKLQELESLQAVNRLYLPHYWKSFKGFLCKSGISAKEHLNENLKIKKHFYV